MPRESKQERKGKQRDAAPENHWQVKIPQVNIGTHHFSLKVITGRERGDKRMNIDNLVTSFSWDDTEVVMRGSLTVNSVDLKFGLGDTVICQVQIGNKQAPEKELWRMQIEREGFSAQEGVTSFELVSPLGFMARSKEDWMFKKEDSKGKKGWYADEIARKVCQKYEIPVGRLARPEFKITNMVKRNVGPLDMIVAAYKEAVKDVEGVQYVVTYRENTLNVQELSYSLVLYKLGAQLLEATLDRGVSEELASVITVTAATDGKKDGTKAEIEEEVVSKKLIARYGRIHRFMKEDEVNHAAQGRKWAKREMKRTARPTRDVSITVPGMPQIRRGDAIKLRVPELGLNRIVFVASVSHSVSAGQVSSDVVIRFEDDVANLEECAEKCRKAREAGREAPAECNCQKEEEDEEDADENPESTISERAARNGQRAVRQ